MAKCLRSERDDAAASLERYKEEVLRLLSTQPEAKEAFAASQTAWQAYFEAECQAVYMVWKGGSLRNVQYLGCQIWLTTERTWALWSTYLRRKVTELPEPKRRSSS